MDQPTKMQGTMPEEQTDVKRTEPARLYVTPQEKQALRVVAALRGLSESEVLRESLIADVVAEFEARVTIDADAA